MTLQSVLSAGRAAAERRMTSRCSIMRRTGTTDNAAGFQVDAWAVIHSDLPMRLKPGRGFRTVRIGDSEVQVALREVEVPALTPDVRDDDLVDVTRGERVGVVLQIAEATGADQQTALRLPVFEVPRPEEWG